MVEDSRDNKSTFTAGTRCVILVGPGHAAAAELLGGLARRGVSTAVVSEPAGVMVELTEQTNGILIVVDPDDRPWLDDLVQAVRLYHPRTVRWCYRSQHPSGHPQLQPLTDPHAAAEANAPHTDPAPTDQRDASLHFTLPNPRSPLGRVQSQVPRERMRSLVVKVQGPAEVGEPLISEEELAMLLGPVPEDPGDGAGYPGYPGERGGRP